MTIQEKEILNELRDSYISTINSISSDFINDRALLDSDYISDSFSEYADGATSIYYSDQWNYYVDNSSKCEDALLEFYDPDSIADLIKKEGLYHLCCKAGALGQYVENESELYEDEEKIKRCLIIDYLLNINEYLDPSDIEEIAQEDFDRWDDYADLVNKKIMGE